MPKFQLNKDTKTTYIADLLNNYSSLLSSDNREVLNGLVECKIENNKIIYNFKIEYGRMSVFKIFKIIDMDMGGNISFTIFYLDSTETHYMNINELENKIDEVISSKKMGDLIKYLLRINLLTNNKTT